MEGTGSCSSNGQGRREATILNFDLNKEPEPEPELEPEPEQEQEPAPELEQEQGPEQEQLPYDDAPDVLNPDPELPVPPRVKVICDLEEEDPQVDMLFDVRNIEQHKVDVVVNNSKFVREGRDVQVCGADIREDGGIKLLLGIKKVAAMFDNNNSSRDESAGTKQESTTVAGRKRSRSCTAHRHDHIAHAEGDESSAESSSAENKFGPPKIRWKSLGMEGDVNVFRG